MMGYTYQVVARGTLPEPSEYMKQQLLLEQQWKQAQRANRLERLDNISAAAAAIFFRPWRRLPIVLRSKELRKRTAQVCVPLWLEPVLMICGLTRER